MMMICVLDGGRLMMATRTCVRHHDGDIDNDNHHERDPDVSAPAVDNEDDTSWKCCRHALDMMVAMAMSTDIGSDDSGVDVKT